jgi:hypothetical protein
MATRAAKAATNGTTRTNGSKPRQVGISKVDARVAQLEEQVQTLIWLHAELSYAIKAAAAAQMAQQLQPQIQQAILQRLQGQVAPGGAPQWH